MATAYATTHNLKLSFSTWVCPEWSVAAIVDGMQSYGYDGVELRIGKGHKHNVDLETPADVLAGVRKQFDNANMAISCIATSYSFSAADALERAKTIAAVKQCLLLADSVGAPYVRVFGGDIPHGLEVAGVIDYVAEALDECTEYAETEKLRSMILIETQGAFSHSKYVSEVLSQVFSPKLGVLWDVLHPIRVLEQAEDTYDAICDHVRHVHVHDCTFNEDRTKIQPCPPGEGFVPMPQVVEAIRAIGFTGYANLETDTHPGATVESDMRKNLAFVRGLMKG